MEKDDFLDDDFLKKVLKGLPEDSPSDDFVLKVMEKITPETADIKEKKPFYMILMASWPYILVSLAVLLFIFTSDLPFSDLMPGKDVVMGLLGPYLTLMKSSFRDLFGRFGDLSLVYMISGAAFLFFLIDKLFTIRRAENTVA